MLSPTNPSEPGKAVHPQLSHAEIEHQHRNNLRINNIMEIFKQKDEYMRKVRHDFRMNNRRERSGLIRLEVTHAWHLYQPIRAKEVDSQQEYKREEILRQVAATVEHITKNDLQRCQRNMDKLNLMNQRANDELKGTRAGAGDGARAVTQLAHKTANQDEATRLPHQTTQNLNMRTNTTSNNDRTFGANKPSSGTPFYTQQRANWSPYSTPNARTIIRMPGYCTATQTTEAQSQGMAYDNPIQLSPPCPPKSQENNPAYDKPTQRSPHASITDAAVMAGMRTSG